MAFSRRRDDGEGASGPQGLFEGAACDGADAFRQCGAFLAVGVEYVTQPGARVPRQAIGVDLADEAGSDQRDLRHLRHPSVPPLGPIAG